MLPLTPPVIRLQAIRSAVSTRLPSRSILGRPIFSTSPLSTAVTRVLLEAMKLSGMNASSSGLSAKT